MVKKRLKDLHHFAKQQFTEKNIDNPTLESRLLICHAFDLSAEDFIMQSDNHFDDSQLLPLLERRLTHEPMSKIIGEKEFWSRSFITNSHTLDPRPDSETLIASVLDHLSDRNHPYRFLDLGTGTGCLLLTVLAEYPHATGIGVDISHDALVVAQRNAERFDLGTRVDWQQGDWDCLSGSDQKFDCVISNPPYVATNEKLTLSSEVLNHDPSLALFGGEDGLDCYRGIVPFLTFYLKNKGWIAFECGQGQAESICDLLTKKSFLIQSVEKDLSGIDRVVVGQKV